MTKIYPYISEKSADLAKRGKFTLLAPLGTTKGQVLLTLREVFNVHPTGINPANKKSMNRLRLRRKSLDRGFKKFVVTLPKGESLTGFESILEEKKEKGKKKTDVQVSKDKK